MASLVRRQFGTPRHYRGEEAATAVLRWLNQDHEQEYVGNEYLGRYLGKNTRASRERVIWLIETARAVRVAVREAPQRDLLAFPTRKLAKLDNQLNKFLLQYPTVPSFYLTCGRECMFDDNTIVGGRRPVGEALAVFRILELSNMGLLDRLHKCDCGRWLFSRFKHQRFCSDRCRKRSFEKSSNTNRSEYMRWYYGMYQSPKSPKKKLTFEQWKRANRAKRGA